MFTCSFVELAGVFEFDSAADALDFALDNDLTFLPEPVE